MTFEALSARINSLFVGAAQSRWAGRPPSAIDKRATDQVLRIDELGLVADEQADLDVHGGVDKAIHHYPGDHYPTWIAEHAIAAGTHPAAFGENLTTLGLTEELLCIGDVLRLGSATVQVSQGRQPCWKLSMHTGNDKMAYLFQKTGRTGWYYRVLEPGHVVPGDLVTLIERPQPNWSVERVTRARLTRRATPAEAEAMAQLPELATGWREAFDRMAGGERAEDTSARLEGQVKP